MALQTSLQTPADTIRLALELMAIDSTTGREAECGHYLLRFLAGEGYAVKPIHVDVGAGPERFCVYAQIGTETPDIVLSTHMDTVPPYIPPSEDDDFLRGRGACDAKGIIAAQVTAAGRLRAAGVRAAMLFTVGEERDSAGARAANPHAPGSRYMINGEPTDNRMAVASKGTLHITLRAHGRMAHSAYPELGDSAIHKLVHATERVLALPLPVLEDVGPSTLNVGMIEGGYAPNVIADAAEAKVLVRLVGDHEPVLAAVRAAAGDDVEVLCDKETRFVRLHTLANLPTMVASFGTDIPSLPDWGKAVLYGPGSIHVAHTPLEHLRKSELFESVDGYVGIARRLLAGE